MSWTTACAVWSDDQVAHIRRARTRDVGMLTRQNGAELEEILAFPGDAARPVVDSTYPLTREGVRDAFERLKSRRARGKIVIDVA